MAAKDTHAKYGIISANDIFDFGQYKNINRIIAEINNKILIKAIKIK